MSLETITEPAARKMLALSDIIDANDAKIVEVEVPEWGGFVGVRAMTGTERDAFEAALIAAKEKSGGLPPNLRATFLSHTLCNADGSSFGATPEALGKKSGNVLDRLFKVAQTLNALDTEAQERLGKD